MVDQDERLHKTQVKYWPGQQRHATLSKLTGVPLSSPTACRHLLRAALEEAGSEAPSFGVAYGLKPTALPGLGKHFTNNYFVVRTGLGDQALSP